MFVNVYHLIIILYSSSLFFSLTLSHLYAQRKTRVSFQVAKEDFRLYMEVHIALLISNQQLFLMISVTKLLLLGLLRNSLSIFVKVEKRLMTKHDLEDLRITETTSEYIEEIQSMINI